MMMKRTMNQLTSTPIRIPKTRASCMDPPPNTTLDGGRPHQPRALIGNAVLGMSLGLFVSAFASTEFQAVQFMPAFALPLSP